MLADLDRRLGPAPAPVRLLVEAALQDAAARAEGTSAAARLAGTPVPQVSLNTHQTLFHGSREAILKRAETYWERGFAALKLRIGFGDLDAEIALLAALRERFGPALALSADANGALAEGDVLRNLDRLAELRLDYLEQPLPPRDWEGLRRLARRSPVPIMLDESADSGEALDRIAASGLPFLVHLKLVKQGGLDRLLEAARRLQGSGIGVMVGQMNEGGLATAAALAAALAVKPRFAELYGADNLLDDPNVGVRYENGAVAAGEIGIGAALVGPTSAILERKVAR
jgi:L-alanine-DL-glutamate epimerase-like enolase superfamily enzyme